MHMTVIIVNYFSTLVEVKKLKMSKICYSALLLCVSNTYKLVTLIMDCFISQNSKLS